MATNVTAVVLGGQPKVLTDVSTVQDIVSSLSLGENHSVKINGDDATYSSEVKDYDFISFGEKVKGGSL